MLSFDLLFWSRDLGAVLLTDFFLANLYYDISPKPNQIEFQTNKGR